MPTRARLSRSHAPASLLSEVAFPIEKRSTRERKCGGDRAPFHRLSPLREAVAHGLRHRERSVQGDVDGARRLLLLRIGAGGRLLDFGVATTKAERAAVLAQRFRVYQRHGYYRPGLRVDRDAYDRRAIYFVATLAGAELPDLVIGSARLILGEPDSAFRFPAEKFFGLELPEAILAFPTCQRVEVSRLVTERPEGVVLGSLLTPLGLIQAMALYSLPRGIRCGLAPIKRRLLLALRGLGLPFYDLRHTGVTYPRHRALAGYFYHHPDPVVPVYWLVREMAPAVVRARAR